MHLETPRSQQGLIDHVLPIGHADEQEIVEFINTVELRQKLVHNGITDSCSSCRSSASLLAHSIQLVEYNDVQLAIIALLLILLFGVCEHLAHVLFGLSNILV